MDKSSTRGAKDDATPGRVIDAGGREPRRADRPLE